jgi:hypothetical protein
MGDLAHKVRLALVLALIASATLSGVPAVASAQFGIASLSAQLTSSQAGAHADFSSSLALDTEALGNPVSQLRTATFALPEGMIGNPQAIERCPVLTFEELDCNRNSQVGELSLTAVQCRGASLPLQQPAEAGTRLLVVSDAHDFCTGEAGSAITVGSGASAQTTAIATIVNETTLELDAPLEHSYAAGEDVTHIANSATEEFSLFNIEPTPGHVATFAASLLLAQVYVEVKVGPEGRLSATISETSTVLDVVASTVTLWGVPANASHNAHRCNEFFECAPASTEPAAFMTNPTSCDEVPSEAVTVTSWQGEVATKTAALPSMTGCEQLAMSPSLTVVPSTTRQSSPAGYELALRVPQEESPYGLATPALNSVSVTLPRGTSLTPGVANGLAACETSQFSEDACPDASRVGSAEVTTPLLREPLKGSLYIGAPTASEKYRLFMRISADGVALDLQGQVQASEETGQTTTVFADVPQLEFETLKVDFFGGPSAVLANGMACGPATSGATMTSYAGQVASASSTFSIDEASEGGACLSNAPFAPSFVAGTESAQSGRSTSFMLRIARTDEQQDLAGFTTHLPPGLVGLLSSVPLCPEPAATDGECSHASAVGTATVAAGAGPSPLYLSGPVYLTGPYDGAPFGLDVVMNAAAGPFDLGTALVRSRILVNPSSLAITIASSPFPQIMGGVPLRLRSIEVDLDRAGFIVTPTDCTPRSIDATIQSSEGADTEVSTPYQVNGCASLPFTPTLAASTQATASREGDGASLDVDITKPAGSGASIHTVQVELPSQLRPRLTAIQHACLAAGQLVSLASCPSQSRVGVATVTSPVTAVPLSGAIYLVAHGGEALPSLVTHLEGQGLEVDLEGQLGISSKGVITTDFESLPDAPISSFDLTLPRGPSSMLGASAPLCGKRLLLPYTFADAAGLEVKGRVPVSVGGCPRHASSARRPRRRHGSRSAAKDGTSDLRKARQR